MGFDDGILILVFQPNGSYSIKLAKQIGQLARVHVHL